MNDPIHKKYRKKRWDVERILHKNDLLCFILGRAYDHYAV